MELVDARLGPKLTQLLSLTPPPAAMMSWPPAASTIWRSVAMPSGAVGAPPEVSTRWQPQRMHALMASIGLAETSIAR